MSIVIGRSGKRAQDRGWENAIRKIGVGVAVAAAGVTSQFRRVSGVRLDLAHSQLAHR